MFTCEGIHYINGEEHQLKKEHVVLIRPEDIHGFFGSTQKGLGWRNVAIPNTTPDYIKENYFQYDDDFWGRNR